MRTKSATLIGAISLVGALVGGASGMLLSHQSQSDNGSIHQAVTASSFIEDTPPATGFEVNSAGETFGSLANSTGIDDAPDLVAVDLAGSQTGYVRSSELFAAEGLLDNPTSPAEALALQDERVRRGPVELTAYAEDGITVVGTFIVQTADDQ